MKYVLLSKPLAPKFSFQLDVSFVVLPHIYDVQAYNVSLF